MGKYEGSLRTSEHEAALSASLELEDGRVKISIGDTPIGDWSLKEVQFEKIPSGYKVAAEGEHVLMDLDPNDALALGVQLNNTSKKKRRRTKSPVDSEPKQETKRPRKEAKVSRKLRKQRAAEESAAPEVTPAPETPQPNILEPRAFASEPEPAVPDPIIPASQPEPVQVTEELPASPELEPVAMETEEPTVEEAPRKETRKARRAREKAEKAARVEAAKADKAAKSAAAKAEKASRERLSVFRWFKTKIPHYIDSILDVVEPKLEPYLPKWVFNRATVILVFAAVLAVPIFPGIMSMVLLILGGLIVALGAVVYSDSVMASRLLYGRTTPSQVLVVGVVTFFLGLAIAIIAN